MIKGLIKIALLLVIGVLVYNYFFGDAEEKATSQKVFTEIKDVGKAVTDFVKDEHQRIKDGKFKKVLDRINESLDNVEAKVRGMDDETKRNYARLRDKTTRMGKFLEKVDDDASNLSEEERKQYEMKMKDLLRRTNKFFDEHMPEEK